MVFISKEKHKVGLGLEGVAVGHWFLTFENGIARWDWTILMLRNLAPMLLQLMDKLWRN